MGFRSILADQDLERNFFGIIMHLFYQDYCKTRNHMYPKNIEMINRSWSGVFLKAIFWTNESYFLVTLLVDKFVNGFE